MHPQQTFSKKERLCAKKLTENLFKKSHSFFEFPFKVVYFFADSFDSVNMDYPVQVLFTASKRVLKKAVERNSAKRKMREAYRKHKLPLYNKLDESDRKLVVGFIYNGLPESEYQRIEQKIILIINRLIQQVEKEVRKTNIHTVNHHQDNHQEKT